MINLFLKSFDVNEFQIEGVPLLNFNVKFDHWFTIVTGSNGTGKSTLLRLIKTSYNDRAVFYNPKRNSERKAILQYHDEYVRGGKNKESIASTKKSFNFNDNIFEPYSSYSEIIVSDFDTKWKNSKGKLTADEIIKDLELSYGKLLKKIFPAYKFKDWSFVNGGPYFKIEKYNKYAVESESLSTGEQEILSLVFNIVYLQDTYDILLIDEPELHLNWALENNLFSFLKEFSVKNKKQIIISSHSRAIFEDEFKENLRYLFFDINNNIVCSDIAPEIVKKQIRGEVQKITLSKEAINIYAEDASHVEIIDIIAKKLNKTNYNLQILKDKQSVESLFDAVKMESTRGILENSFFVMDGDRQVDKFPSDKTYVKLDKYCIESTLFDLKIMNKVSGKSIIEIKQIIVNEINKNKRKKSNKGDILILGQLVVSDLKQSDLNQFDCSKIINNVVKKLGFSNKLYKQKYIEYCITNKKAKSVFGYKLIEMIESLPNI